MLRDRTGFSGALPPVFAADGRLTAAACPRCGAETTTRVCPACHSQLPVHFGKVRSRLIVLVGAKESGKTVFMTVLVHELMHRVGEQLNAAISGADDNTRHRFASDYEKPLYRERGCWPRPRRRATRNRAPLVFRFTTEGRGRRPGRPAGRGGRAGPSRSTRCCRSSTRRARICARQQSVEQNVRYLAAADGIVLLLDPLQMRGARQLAAPGTRLPTPGAVDDEPADRAGEHHRSHPGHRGDQAERADQQAARHRVLQDGRASARPQGDQPAAAAPGPGAVLRRAGQPGGAHRDPAAAGPVGGVPDRPDRPAALPQLPLFRGVRARRDAHRRTIACRRAASALTGWPTRSYGSWRSSAPFR